MVTWKVAWALEFCNGVKHYVNEFEACTWLDAFHVFRWQIAPMRKMVGDKVILEAMWDPDVVRYVRNREVMNRDKVRYWFPSSDKQIKWACAEGYVRGVRAGKKFIRYYDSSEISGAIFPNSVLSVCGGVSDELYGFCPLWRGRIVWKRKRTTASGEGEA